MCLSVLLLGVTPHSGMCVSECAVARSYSTLLVCVCLSVLLLGVTPHSGMCVSECAVATP